MRLNQRLSQGRTREFSVLTITLMPADGSTRLIQINAVNHKDQAVIARADRLLATVRDYHAISRGAVVGPLRVLVV
jgi:hypothetical protein